MKTKTVTYSKVFSLGNYENEKIGIEIEVQEDDDIQQVIQKAREFVEFNHQLNGMTDELSKAEYVVQHPDDFTGSQIREAKKRIEAINEKIRSGTQLLLM